MQDPLGGVGVADVYCLQWPHFLCVVDWMKKYAHKKKTVNALDHVLQNHSAHILHERVSSWESTSW